MNLSVSKNLNFFFISLLLLLFSCKPEVKRYLSPDDTSYSEDVRAVSRRINKDPQNADLYYKRSNTFFFEDKFKEALADIAVAIELSPQTAFYYFKQGEYYMAGDTADAKQAEKSYLKAIELDPEQEETRMKYGILLLAKQRYKETVEQMNAVLTLNPANADALFFLGMANKETGDTARAIERFQETVELSNTYYNAYMQLALLYLNKNADLAILYLDNAIRIDEFSDEAHYTKGLLLQNRGEYIPAREFYKRTIELNPSHRFAYYNLAFMETMDNNFTKALEYLEKLLTLDSDYVPALHFRGAIYKQMGMKNKALKDWEKATRLEPENEEIQADLAELEH